MDDSTPRLKVCERCGATLPSPRAGQPRRYCSDGCRRRTYYAEHREEVRAYQTSYNAAHRDKRRAYQAAYYAAHREEWLTRAGAYRATHREELRARAAANLEKGRAYSHNRRARHIAAPGTHTAADVAAQYLRQRGRCYWCKERVGEAYHVDHVFPVTKGGSNGPENLVITCPTCNMSKYDKLPHEFSDRLC